MPAKEGSVPQGWPSSHAQVPQLWILLLLCTPLTTWKELLKQHQESKEKKDYIKRYE